MKPSVVLRSAADVIRKRGWFQGWYGPYREYADGDRKVLRPKTCPVCALGAVRVAAGYAPDSDDGRTEDAEAYLRRSTRTYVDTWNDDPTRTVEDVLAAFEKAALLAESEGK